MNEEDTLKGPCRLIATDTRLYLLDQLNNRVLCYDTAGIFVDQFKTPCDAVDMALDSYSRFYFLDNHNQPATVVVTEKEEEISRFKVRYEEKRPVDGLVVYPGDSLVFKINQQGFYRLTIAFDSKGREARGIYCLERIRYPVSYANLMIDFDGSEYSGFTHNREIGRKSPYCISFLGDDSTERILS